MLDMPIWREINVQEKQFDVTSDLILKGNDLYKFGKNIFRKFMNSLQVNICFEISKFYFRQFKDISNTDTESIKLIQDFSLDFN